MIADQGKLDANALPNAQLLPDFLRDRYLPFTGSIRISRHDERVVGNQMGYSAYNPESIVRLLGIFRVFYNYCLPGKDKKTPAMRIGLAKGPVSLEDIIYY